VNSIGSSIIVQYIGQNKHTQKQQIHLASAGEKTKHLSTSFCIFYNFPRIAPLTYRHDFYDFLPFKAQSVSHLNLLFNFRVALISVKLMCNFGVKTNGIVDKKKGVDASKFC
jgi:hypothetical protein